MITDQKQTGVPNGTLFSSPKRMQLIKPNQVNNTGLSRKSETTAGGVSGANIASNLSPNSNNSNQTSTFNPLRPQSQITSQSAQTTPSAPSLSASSTPAPAPSLSLSGLDQARSAIRGMSNADIMTLLNEISDGTLSGKGE